MNTQSYLCRCPIFFAPEHGGNTVKGGHPQGDRGGEQIAEGTGETVPGRGKTPGTADPGVPGSRTNPVHGDPDLESDKPIARPTGEGSGAGS